MNVAAHARAVLERELRQAIERDELELWYRPTLDTAQRPHRGRRSGAPLGAAGTASSGLPVDLFQIAEETGLVEPIGEWMLGRGVPAIPGVASGRSRRCRAWRSTCRRDSSSSADSSTGPADRHGFGDRALLHRARNQREPSDRRGERHRADARRAPGAGPHILPRRLRHAGRRRSRASIGSRSKTSRSIARSRRGSEPKPAPGAMIAAIVATAHALHKRVVADGVETEKQAALLEPSRLRSDPGVRT